MPESVKPSGEEITIAGGDFVFNWSNSKRPQEIASVRPCGCWLVSLGQGKAILACAAHEAKLLAVFVEEPPDA